MDYVQENFNALTSAVSSVIRREVDCLTDEIISSEQKYYCSDLNLSDIIRPFMQHQEVLEIENRIDVGEINSSDVLICVSFECKSERLDEIVQYFKENNAKIVLIAANKKSNIAYYSKEIIGVSVDGYELDEGTQRDIFSQVVLLLLGVINRKLKKVPV